MQLPQPRPGQILEVKKRPLTFSKWPSRTGRLHHALQSLIFARDPWLVISKSIDEQCHKNRKSEALACLEQAKDFYVSAAYGGIVAARPLALYYSFMNLAKAFCLTRGTRPTFDQAQHGLKERRNAGSQELTGAYLKAEPSLNPGVIHNFAEFMQALTGTGLAAGTDFQMPVLLPQVVPGHRFWALAQKKTERFIAIHELKFKHDPSNRKMWLDLYFVADDLSRLGVTQQRLLKESRLAGLFHGVVCNEQYRDRPLLRFEQIATYPYPNGYPADRLATVIAPITNLIWTTVATTSPYRRYYVYLAPTGEHPFVLPQLLSIYAVMFYLGSITRYRPHHYDTIVDGKFGPWIQEFVGGQPLQFLYLMASEFMRQDVTRPAIL
jgi:YaaC-like protein